MSVTHPDCYNNDYYLCCQCPPEAVSWRRYLNLLQFQQSNEHKYSLDEWKQLTVDQQLQITFALNVKRMIIGSSCLTYSD